MLSNSKSSPRLEHWPLTRFTPYDRNPRKNDHAVEPLARAISEFGFRVPMLAKSDGTIVDGHLRLKAAQFLSLKTVPVLLADDMTELQIRAFRISVNRMAELADWDNPLLLGELESLIADGFDIDLTGFTLADIDDLTPDLISRPVAPTLSDRFMIPPFSVLNAREGWWQDRKRQWLSLGIESEVGRGGSGQGMNKHSPTITQHADGTLNYAGTGGEAARFDKQRVAAATTTTKRERKLPTMADAAAAAGITITGADE